MHQKEWLKHPLAVGAIATLCCALWASAFPCVKIGYVLFDITGTAQQILSIFLCAAMVFSPCSRRCS